MKCLRSGHCCIHLDVMIVDDPERDPVENNVIHKPSGEQCKHLEGDTPGQYFCAVHEKEWFPDSPCGQYDQMGPPNADCRVGVYTLKVMYEGR